MATCTREIGTGQVQEALRKLKVEKAPGSDGITAEMLKYGREIVVDWMVWICNLAWEQSKMPEDWRKAIIVLLYIGKTPGSDGITAEMLKYGREIVVDWMVWREEDEKKKIDEWRKREEEKISEEQGGFRNGRGCVDQIFFFRMEVEKILAKGKKIYAAFMDLEKKLMTESTGWYCGTF